MNILFIRVMKKNDVFFIGFLFFCLIDSFEWANQDSVKLIETLFVNNWWIWFFFIIIILSCVGVVFK